MIAVPRHALSLMSVLAVALASMLASTLAITAAHAQPQVNVYNWNDYVDPAMLEAFTRETGIKVVYDTYDNNEIVETKMLAGKSGYDIVVPSAPFLQRMVKANVFARLDKAKLTNLGNVWPEIAQRLTTYDPGNQFAVPYMWGTIGLGLNVAKVQERLGPNYPKSWDLVMKPQFAEKLKDCGIHMLDGPEDILPNVLRYVGLDPNSKRSEDIQKAGDALMRIRTTVRKFHSSEYINALAAGDICVAVGFSGDILQARRRAQEAGNGVDIAYVIPVEGAQMWFDSMVIPADAPNKDNALAFINFMLRPEVAAANSNVVSYASGNLPAKALIKPEIVNDPGVYPDEATFRRLFTNTAFDDRSQRTATRVWTRVKTGK